MTGVDLTGTRRDRWSRLRNRGVVWWAAGAIASATAFAATRFDPQIMVIVGGAGGALLLFLACMWKPVIGTYAYLATLPIIAGIDRGNLLAWVRPNEALLALVLLGALVGAYLRLCRGDPWPLRSHLTDLPLAVFLLLSTVWPIASLMLRGHVPTAGELAAVLPICKLVALYVLVRCTVVRDDQVVRCVRLIIWPATVVALIAILQTLEFAPVLHALESTWSPDANAGALETRGSTTLASPIATGDVIIIASVLTVACGVRRVLPLRELVLAGSVLSCGILAAGQFSTWISAAVAVALLLWSVPDLRRWAWRLLPLAPIPLLIGAPVLMGRFADFGDTGVPVSWQGRWDNLSNAYIPAFEPVNWLIGVTPDPVLVAPETWRDVIYLEAGYLAFLWIGGVPVLAGFVWLSASVLRSVRSQVDRPGAAGAVAMTLRISWIFLLVLTVLDPHLTLRGTGDLLFSLLALTTGRVDVRRSP
ncbi:MULTISPECIES: hypothetical protein [unclassified Pseudonocardia]|uniref:hypothetical protein n=1 Tax=unclassified Pseudonocardia TaxID=2619320 RepID=UPI00095EAE3C|nr:hypothetical protein [Pseudonocardia sp. Ae707_Ps1]OLM20179.1 hypothetical protein Ae707Ps1_4438c [Pseudonocardia sp. Ae707_Ps1]